MNKTTKIILIIVFLLTIGIVIAYLVCGCGPSKKAATEPASTAVSIEPPSAVAPSEAPSINNTSWLELPGQWLNDAEHVVTHYAAMEGCQQRNYTILYDEDIYIILGCLSALRVSHNYGS